MIGSIEEARALAALPPDELRAWLDKCGPRDLLMLDAAFEMWANDGQIEPVAEGWRIWLMMAGRGFGKTRAGAEWIHKLAMSPGRRIGIVGATIDEARSIMIEGVSGLLSVARRHRCKVTWEPSKGEFHWPRGSIATLYSGDKPDGLRGPELHYAWGAAADRDAAVPDRGGRRGQCSTRQPAQRNLLPGRGRADRRMVRPCQCTRWMDRRGVAICRSG